MGPISPVCNGRETSRRFRVPSSHAAPPFQIERRQRPGGAGWRVRISRRRARPRLAGGRGAGGSGSPDPESPEGVGHGRCGGSRRPGLSGHPRSRPRRRATYQRGQARLAPFLRPGRDQPHAGGLRPPGPHRGAPQGRRRLRLRSRRRGAGGLPRGRCALRRGPGHHRRPGRLRRRRRPAHPPRRRPVRHLRHRPRQVRRNPRSRLAHPGESQPDRRHLHGPRQGRRHRRETHGRRPLGRNPRPDRRKRQPGLRTPHSHHPGRSRLRRRAAHRPRPPHRRRGDGPGVFTPLPEGEVSLGPTRGARRP